MKEENVILEKSYAFALEIMGLAKQLREQREYDLASQLWRSGTNIGANVEEAQAAQSRADFRSKTSIAAKEARETHYWLRLTRDGKVLPEDRTNTLINDIESTKRIPDLHCKILGRVGILQRNVEFLNSAQRLPLPSKIQNPPSKINFTP